MSDDIVAELIETAKLYDRAGIDGSAGADMCYQAASELARLRAERDAAREEVQRLQEVMHDVDDFLQCLVHISQARSFAEQARGLIRAALQEGETARATPAPNEGGEG